MRSVIVDGRDVDPDAPAIGPLDHGLLGHGVYESIRTYDGVAFALTEHLERLAAGAAVLAIEAPVDVLAGEVERAAQAVVGAAAQEARIRIVLTTSGTRIVSADPLPDRRADAESGIAVVTLPWPRATTGPVAGVKVTSTAATRVALAWAREHGGATGLWLTPEGNVAEVLTANVFAVLEGALVTPPLTAGILSGVTRTHLLAWAREDGVEVAERDLALDELRSADEAFVSATSEPVVPIVTLDGRPIGRAGGPFVRRLQRLFEERARAAPVRLP